MVVSLLKFVTLGLVQGLTEFLPISSSAHLVFSQTLFGVDKDILLIDVVLHLGTLLAVVTFFRKDILDVLKNAKMIGYILLVTVLTGLIGFFLKPFVEPLFTNARPVAFFLLFNGLLLLWTKKFQTRNRPMTLADSGLLGLAQGCAVTPGISRSGLTITTLLARGFKPEEAFRISFLASLPAVFGAFLLETKAAWSTHTTAFSLLAAGFLASYASGLLALVLLIKTIKNKQFHLFGYYCLALGTLVLLVLRKS
ncbi:MAG: undecaprenyl-diphosphate phosphatase [Candidatus Omnitrophota bacterium]